MNIEKSKGEGFWIRKYGKSIAWAESFHKALEMIEMLKVKDKYFPKKQSFGRLNLKVT